MRVVGVSEIRAIESRLFQSEIISESLIIENVGIRIADFIEEELAPEETYDHIFVLVGSGNNGADALAAARQLAAHGFGVSALLVFPGKNGSVEFQKQLTMVSSFGVEVCKFSSVDHLEAMFYDYGRLLIIDGVLGTGFQGKIAEDVAELFALVNSVAQTIVSIDIASGLSGENGIGNGESSIMADITLAIALPKIGHFIGDGPELSGELVVLSNVGFPPDIFSGGDKRLLCESDALPLLTERNKFAHKYDFGSLLLVGGARGYTGAIAMAAEAALKVGAGVVTAAVYQDSSLELAGRIIKEVVLATIGDVKIKNYDAAVIGPGLGSSEEGRQILFDMIRNFTGPLVVDADGINLLAREDNYISLLRERTGPLLFTPHMGELRRLLACPNDTPFIDLLERVKVLSASTNSFFIIKGACSIVVMPDGQLIFACFANDGMATAGSGDVLAGIIGGIIVQDDHGDFDRTIPAAILLHACAGKLASEQRGSRSMLATDIIRQIPHVLGDDFDC